MRGAVCYGNLTISDPLEISSQCDALAGLYVRRPRCSARILILALVVAGIFSYFSLGVDLFPKVDVPTVLVTISNPGASPEEIESEISKKVEDAINTISHGRMKYLI